MGIFRKKNKNSDVKDKQGKVVETQKTIMGTKINKKLSVDETSDFYFELHNKNANKLYKISIILMALSLLCLMFTFFYLLTRTDSTFYATSADGRVYKLESREVPNGSFNIKPYKDSKK